MWDPTTNNLREQSCSVIRTHGWMWAVCKLDLIDSNISFITTSNNCGEVHVKWCFPTTDVHFCFHPIFPLLTYKQKRTKYQKENRWKKLTILAIFTSYIYHGDFYSTIYEVICKVGRGLVTRSRPAHTVCRRAFENLPLNSKSLASSSTIPDVGCKSTWSAPISLPDIW